MDKKTDSATRRKWKKEISKMNSEELQERLLSDNDCTEYLELVYERLTKVKHDELEKDVIDILKEMECPLECDEEGIHFEYKGEPFTISACEIGLLVNIAHYRWKVVNLDDENEVSRMVHTVNWVNHFGYVRVLYDFEDDEGVVSVSSYCDAMFDSPIPKRKEYLEFLLNVFLHIQACLNDRMQELRMLELNEEKMQGSDEEES